MTYEEAVAAYGQARVDQYIADNGVRDLGRIVSAMAPNPGPAYVSLGPTSPAFAYQPPAGYINPSQAQASLVTSGNPADARLSIAGMLTGVPDQTALMTSGANGTAAPLVPAEGSRIYDYGPADPPAAVFPALSPSARDFGKWVLIGIVTAVILKKVL